MFTKFFHDINEFPNFLGASSMPPITTHNIVDEHNDPVMNAFRRCQLFNNHYDRVKVSFVYCSPPLVFTKKRIAYTYSRIF